MVVKIKIAKDTKECVIKRQRNIEHCKNCLKANQSENKIYHLDKNQTDVESIRKIIKK